MWQGIEGHDTIVEYFRRAVSRNRLSGSYLFIGPEGVGKRTFALKLAQALLCSNVPETELAPCGQCASCRGVANLMNRPPVDGTGNVISQHPDLKLVFKPEERAFIPLEILIGTPDNRTTGIPYFLTLSPQISKRKVVIIDDADYFNPEGANSLLKTLEEPSPHSLVILLGTSTAKQLPTIRSRCKIVRFAPLQVDLIEWLLTEKGMVSDPSQARFIAMISQGSMEQARMWILPQYEQFRTSLLGRLGTIPFNGQVFSSEVISFADDISKNAAKIAADLDATKAAAGETKTRTRKKTPSTAQPGVLADTAKKTPATIKRNAIDCAMKITLEFFTAISRSLNSYPWEQSRAEGRPESLFVDQIMQNAVEQRLQVWNGDVETASLAIDIILEHQMLLFRNVNMNMVCENWANEMAELMIRGRRMIG